MLAESNALGMRDALIYGLLGANQRPGTKAREAHTGIMNAWRAPSGRMNLIGFFPQGAAPRLRWVQAFGLLDFKKGLLGSFCSLSVAS